MDVIAQAGAIPHRDGKVLLITSSRGRWIFPKGFVEEGETAGQTARKEAAEEAGVRGELSHEPVGSYVYEKWGRTLEVRVYLLRVIDDLSDWPDRGKRERRWCRPAEALGLIEDAGLRGLMERAAPML